LRYKFIGVRKKYKTGGVPLFRLRTGCAMCISSKVKFISRDSTFKFAFVPVPTTTYHLPVTMFGWLETFFFWYVLMWAF